MTPEHNLSELSTDKRRIAAYLHDQIDKGTEYLRSSDIADAIGLSSKQVGAHLSQLDDDLESLSISKWGRHRSTTWCIQPESES